MGLCACTQRETIQQENSRKEMVFKYLEGLEKTKEVRVSLVPELEDPFDQQIEEQLAAQNISRIN